MPRRADSRPKNVGGGGVPISQSPRQRRDKFGGDGGAA